MASPCWICRTQEDGLEDALVAPLLSHLTTKNKVLGCSSQCEELRSSSEVILAHFYRLACGHYCTVHLDHCCCACRAKKSSQQLPKAASRH